MDSFGWSRHRKGGRLTCNSTCRYTFFGLHEVRGFGIRSKQCRGKGTRREIYTSGPVGDLKGIWRLEMSRAPPVFGWVKQCGSVVGLHHVVTFKAARVSYGFPRRGV